MFSFSIFGRVAYSFQADREKQTKMNSFGNVSKLCSNSGSKLVHMSRNINGNKCSTERDNLKGNNANDRLRGNPINRLWHYTASTLITSLFSWEWWRERGIKVKLDRQRDGIKRNVCTFICIIVCACRWHSANQTDCEKVMRCGEREEDQRVRRAGREGGREGGRAEGATGWWGERRRDSPGVNDGEIGWDVRTGWVIDRGGERWDDRRGEERGRREQ